MCEIIESFFFLKLNFMIKYIDFFVSVFEFVIDIINGEVIMLFVELIYILVIEEVECIGVDYVV